MKETVKIVITGELPVDRLEALMTELEDFRLRDPERIHLRVTAMSGDANLGDEEIRSALAILRREGAL